MTVSPPESVDMMVDESKDMMRAQSTCSVGVHDVNCSDTDSLSTSTSSYKHSVSFHEVQVHEFAQWLGDNPSCSEGPPIALSWDCVHSKVLKVDEYETMRGRRRREQELITCVHQRTNVIKWCLGYTDLDIRQQEAQILKIRKRQEASVRRYRQKMMLKDIVKGIKAMTLNLLRL